MMMSLVERGSMAIVGVDTVPSVRFSLFLAFQQ